MSDAKKVRKPISTLIKQILTTLNFHIFCAFFKLKFRGMGRIGYWIGGKFTGKTCPKKHSYLDFGKKHEAFKAPAQGCAEIRFPNGTETEAKSFPCLRNGNGNPKSTEIHGNGNGTEKFSKLIFSKICKF